LIACLITVEISNISGTKALVHLNFNWSH